MAKRGRPPKKKPETEKVEPVAEERSSFLPQEAPAKEEVKIEAVTEMDTDTDVLVGPISLVVKESRPDGFFDVSLTIPPLRTCEEPLRSRLVGSPEQRAANIAGAIERAARAAVSAGINQHARKQVEESAAKERFENRA